ncbi:class I SAM-dependent methyltransferase [Kibdelosporangium philippinense]|uniref:Class I SAM-dependent methyltransferase n=1 Tax=Kibdelosporangium philippinense TaxID=211113 RepID=A0ABS8ZQ75_9PSEU|nr:class I SAM-dependent methyltransferase [Kibdelosporangium philippinense]MCE7009729.1 class I SAM-dependent methyltransferase [Kibdelosporangium philippinense]
MTAQPGLVFGVDPAHYDQHRPAVPELAVEWLLPADSAVVVDVGAGTGHLTRILLERAAKVIAVDPDEQMCGWLRARFPDATVHLGSSEHLPVSTASADAVLTSNAWHWFDPAKAGAEAARCLKPGGVLGVSWHDRGPSDMWLDEVQDVIFSAHNPSRPLNKMKLPEDLPFGPVEKHVIGYEREMTPQEICAMHSTYSAIISLADDEREALLDKLYGHFADRAADRGTPTLGVPFVATLYRTYRLA